MSFGVALRNSVAIGLGGIVALFSGFGASYSPLSLFAAGQQGAWLEASDISTLFQTDDTSTPVTAAGQAVGRWQDKSGRNNHATQANVAQRGLYQVSPARITLDKVDDRLVMTVPSGGFVGTMVLATPEGTAAYGVNIPAGSYNIGGSGGTGGQYFPGTAMQGYIIRNGALTQGEIDQAITYLRDNGGGPDYGVVTLFTNFWRTRSELTAFPVIDTSAGTSFSSAWNGCSSLTSFPLLNTAAGTNFSLAWSGCSSLTSFPLLNTAAGTSFSNAWQGCSSLTSFPLIDTSNGTSFQTTWSGCSSLTSFPLIDTSNGTNFLQTWFNCSSLTSFPLIDTSNGTNLSDAWRNCSSLTSFPLLNTAAGTNFTRTWLNCSSLTSFPLINTAAGTNFLGAWQGCSSLTTFPANFFDGCAATNFASAFLSTNLTQASIDGILVSIESNGTSGGTFNQSGGSAPSATGEAAITALRARGWTVTVTGGF
jgi:hypothetical protein